MLYTLVGNGDANEREVLATLESLAAAGDGPDYKLEPADPNDSFWMLLKAEESPSSTVKAVVEWLNKGGHYYEVVAENDTEPSSIYELSEYSHPARRPMDRLVKLTATRLNPGERSAMLILDPDLDNNDDILYAAGRAIDNDIPVYDLGSAMLRLSVEDDDTPPESPTQEPETDDGPSTLAEHLAQEAGMDTTDGDLPKLTREDLDDLILAELKDLVDRYDVWDDVSDKRSKEAMIEALLGAGSPAVVPDQPDTQAIEEMAQEEPEAPTKPTGETLFILEMILPTGEVRKTRLTAEQAELAVSNGAF